MRALRYRLTTIGKSLAVIQRQKSAPSEEVLEILLDRPGLALEEVAVELGIEEAKVRSILDQHIQHGRIIGVVE